MITKPEELFIKMLQSFLDDKKITEFAVSLDFKLLLYFVNNMDTKSNEWRGDITDLQKQFYPNETKAVRKTITRYIDKLVVSQFIYKVFRDAYNDRRAIDTEQVIRNRTLVGVVVNPDRYVIGSSKKIDKIRTRLNTDFEIIAKQQHRGLI